MHTKALYTLREDLGVASFIHLYILPLQNWQTVDKKKGNEWCMEEVKEVRKENTDPYKKTL